MTGPPFRVYNFFKFNVKFMLNKKAKYFDPQNLYISEKSVKNESFTNFSNKTYAELSFIPITEKLVKDLLTAELTFTPGSTQPPNPLSIPAFSPHSSLGEFLNIPTSKIISALGPEGIILTRLSITNINKPIVTPMYGTNIEFTQINSDGTSTTFTPNQTYKITYQRDPNPTEFVCILTNMGISNYSAIHLGLLVPVGPENAINIVNGEIVWDMNKLAADVYNHSMPLEMMFLDKGKKILTKFEGSQKQQPSVSIPQYLADGTPIDVNKALTTFHYMSTLDPNGEYQFTVGGPNGKPISWNLARPDNGTIFAFFKN